MRLGLAAFRNLRKLAKDYRDRWIGIAVGCQLCDVLARW